MSSLRSGMIIDVTVTPTSLSPQMQSYQLSGRQAGREGGRQAGREEGGREEGRKKGRSSTSAPAAQPGSPLHLIGCDEVSWYCRHCYTFLCLVFSSWCCVLALFYVLCFFLLFLFFSFFRSFVRSLFIIFTFFSLLFYG